MEVHLFTESNHQNSREQLALGTSINKKRTVSRFSISHCQVNSSVLLNYVHTVDVTSTRCFHIQSSPLTNHEELALFVKFQFQNFRSRYSNGTSLSIYTALSNKWWLGWDTKDSSSYSNHKIEGVMGMVDRRGSVTQNNIGQK